MGGAASSAAPTEPNIDLVGAPGLWSLGFRGTGVTSTLAGYRRRWRASGPWGAMARRRRRVVLIPRVSMRARPTSTDTGRRRWASWSAGRRGSAIGVAPDATWIAAKIFNDSGTATTTAIHLAFEWALDPDGDPSTADTPAVVNDSWTLGAPGCNTNFQPDLAALTAAGSRQCSPPATSVQRAGHR